VHPPEPGGEAPSEVVVKPDGDNERIARGADVQQDLTVVHDDADHSTSSVFDPLLHW